MKSNLMIISNNNIMKYSLAMNIALFIYVGMHLGKKTMNASDKCINAHKYNGINVTISNRLREILNCKDKEYEPITKVSGDYWMLVNYVRADHGNIGCHETVTYTTHAEFGFFKNILPLVERWRAPISLAVFAPGMDLEKAVDSIRYLRDCTESRLVREMVTFHLIIPSKHMPPSIPSPEDFLKTPRKCLIPPPFLTKPLTYKHLHHMVYPINVARNIAREAALTHFVLPSDVELYPSPNLVLEFLDMIARNERPLTNSKPRVYPINLFEVDANETTPSSKTELQHMLANKTAVPYHKYICQSCHEIPRSNDWLEIRETNVMEIFHIGKRVAPYQHWEPIFICTNKEPFYDERLIWDGKLDKMTQGYILCVKDYEFMILNNAFLVHKPGIKRKTQDQRRDVLIMKQGWIVSYVIHPEMKAMFGIRNGCTI